MSVVTNPEDLAVVKAIRRRVFVEEQGIPLDLDEDGHDESAVHVLAWEGETAVATGRLVIEGPGQGVVARIAVVPEHRGGGHGRRVVRELESLARKAGVRRVSLHPHQHLEGFYASLGYATVAGGAVVGGHRLIAMSKVLD